ncbi:MAG: hypothetical protein ABSA01_04315 [Anaerolineales bacterium]|jgi:hypothetical protein
MSTLEAKPVKAKRILNTKLLPIAALVLVVLALLFLAAPLIRLAGGSQRAGVFVTPGNATTGSPVTGGGPQVLTGSGSPARRFTVGAGGRSGIILYFVMLLVSLAAAVGMLFTKRWGQVLAIIMGGLFGLLGLVSLLPLLLIRFVGAPNLVSLVLGIVHVLLAVSVIVLASIPGKPGLPSAPTPVSAST